MRGGNFLPYLNLACQLGSITGVSIPNPYFWWNGEIAQLQLIDNGSNDTKVKVYDTLDLTYSQHQLVDQLNCTTANQIAYSQHKGVKVGTGAFVLISGTAPTALVRIGSATEASYGYVHDPVMDDVGSEF